MRLNPHLHVLFLYGVYREEGEEVRMARPSDALASRRRVIAPEDTPPERATASKRKDLRGASYEVRANLDASWLQPALISVLHL